MSEPMMDHVNQLIALRDKVVRLETSKCKMRHEKVWLDPETGMPDQQTVPNGVRRVKICSIEVRSKRLSCAHTGSWNTVVDAIMKFCDVTGADNGVRDGMLEEYNQLLRQIMDCDHQKGDQEKVWALLLLQARQEGWDRDTLKQKQDEVARLIRGLVDTHDRIVDSLEAFRLKLIEQMDSTIDTSA